MRRSKLRSQAGFSLIELVVGTAITMIVVGAVVGLQIAIYRLSRAEAIRFETQAEVALAMEWIVRDLRRCVSAEPLGSTLTVELETEAGELRTVQYRLDAATGELVRDEAGAARVLARRVVSVGFLPKADGTVQIEIEARLAGDKTYAVASRVYPRSP